MGINIGDNNRIKNSIIADGECSENKKNWAERHPVIMSIIVSFVVGFILLFSFWDDLVEYLEGGSNGKE